MKKIKSLLLRFVLSISLLVVLSFSSCAPDVSDDAIPFLPFSDIVVNLNLPEYASLKMDGGYKYLKDGGVRGIILYRKNATTYIAYERNSSYHPNEACATVEVHSSGLYIIDTCSNSVFDLSTGNPTSGPAIRPLRQYVVVLTTFELTITDDIAN
jgi:nitrite reductase/ring-hydroxylating ferredoxin subunit